MTPCAELERNLFRSSDRTQWLRWRYCHPTSARDRRPDVRADYLVKRMTIDEKLHLVHGASTLRPQRLPRGAGAWISGIPRLGIPDLYFADGSVGPSARLGQAT